MKIKKLHIDKFRHIENTTIEFGNKLTVISGQNGTGKSTILGWIAQLCAYKGKNLRLNGKFFKEDYRNVFQFCPESDFQNSYKVIFEYTETKGLGLELKKTITTRYQKQTNTTSARYRTDFDTRGRALNYPIVFLGLKRLIPLATEKRITVKENNLSTQYVNTFSSLAKEILILIDDKIKPESLKSANKDMLAIKTNSYSHLGNSAGQDNIGQIISAILSFEKLKKELGNSYDGGLILIDEIDASLYAASQVKLIDKLYRYADKLNLQIIFTTHSLEILEHLDSKIGEDTKINHLIIRDDKVENILNPNYSYVSNKIKNHVKPIKKRERTLFICEDKVAEYWSNNLINGTDLKQLIKIEKGPFPDGTILSMAKSKHSLFINTGFILDGDVKNKIKGNPPIRTTFLPSTNRPETIMYEFIKGLSDNDTFWDDERNFTKQTCFSNYLNGGKGTHKRWFEDETNAEYFGRGYSKLFNRWKKDNKKDIAEFINNLRKTI